MVAGIIRGDRILILLAIFMVVINYLIDSEKILPYTTIEFEENKTRKMLEQIIMGVISGLILYSIVYVVNIMLGIVFK